MKAKLIKKDDNYFLEVDYWYPKFIRPSLIANTFEKPDGDIYNLSKKNCDEIFGVVDVDKLADEYCTYEPKNAKELRDVNLIKLGFRDGFNKAMELNKDNQFTLEDIRIAIVYGEKHRDMDAGKIPYQPFFEFLSSLQKPTEIEVEIEMEKVVDETKVIGAVKGVKGSGHKTTTYKSVPKLDAEGCLILKTI